MISLTESEELECFRFSWLLFWLSFMIHRLIVSPCTIGCLVHVGILGIYFIVGIMHFCLAFSALGAILGILRVGHKKLFLLVCTCTPMYCLIFYYNSVKLCNYRSLYNVWLLQTGVESSAYINMYWINIIVLFWLVTCSIQYNHCPKKYTIRDLKQTTETMALRLPPNKM